MLRKNFVLEQLTVPVLLFVFNSIIAAPLYLGGYTMSISSIESAYISDGRFIAQNFPNIGWYPLWYGGFPFHLTYPPTVPFLIAGLSVASSGTLSVASAYRISTAVFYCATPAMIFLFLRYLTGKRAGALAGALMYSVVPSLLLPGHLNSALPIDLALLAVYGEGPHIVALFFIPISGILYLRALKTRNVSGVTLASLSIAAVLLTELIAAFALALILIILFSSEFAEKDYSSIGRTARPLFATTALIAVVALGLASFWYNLSFLHAIYEFGSGSGPSHSSLYPSFLLAIGMSAALVLALRGDLERRKTASIAVVWLISAALIAFAYLDLGLGASVAGGLLIIVTVALFLSYRGEIPPRRTLMIGLGWTIVFLVIILAWERLNVNLAPQSVRYFPELMMGLSVLVAIVGQMLYDGLSRRAACKKEYKTRFVAIAVIAFLIFFFIVSYSTIPASWNTVGPSSNVQSGPIYESASYLGSHITDNHSVFETSYYAFWLNVFTNVPQVRGGSDQASINSRWWNQIMFLVLYGDNPNLAILWLEAFDVEYVVTYTNSVASAYSIHQDYYNPYNREFTYDEFSGILPLVSNVSGTLIYQIPSSSRLASMVNIGRVESVGVIRSISDSRAILDYLNSSESVGNLTYTYSNPDNVVISGYFQNSSLGVMVKMNYDPAWRATASNGEVVPIVEDPIGFMLLETNASGNLTVTLHYGNTQDVVAGYVVTAITIASLAVATAFEATRRNKRPTIERWQPSAGQADPAREL